jgi:hypothetical protein
MATPWLELIRKRVEGDCDDPCWEQYYTGIDRLLRKVYRYRYGNVTIPSEKPVPLDAEACDLPPRRGNYNFSNGILRVDFDAFADRCWKTMEERERKVLSRELPGDTDCERYLFRVFSRLLQGMVDDLTPFFASRRRQVNNILGQIAYPMTYGKNRCYLLKESSSKGPASRGTLFAVSRNIIAPAPRFPKNPDSPRGPTVPKEAMREYLMKLLAAAGGMVVYSDLLDLIKLVYGLTPPWCVDPGQHESSDEEDGPDDIGLIDILAASRGDIIPTAEIVAMARDFHGRLSEEDRNFFYWRSCREEGVEEIAGRFGCSAATVSGRMRAIIFKLRNYLSGEDISPRICDQEESIAVFAVLQHLVAAEKEAP